MGYVAAAYAPLVVVMGLAADLRLGRELDSAEDPLNIVFWADLITLALFATYVSLAVVFRKRPEVHKRLTLLASIALVGPALARFADMTPGGFAARPIFGIGGVVMLFAGLIAYDLKVRRRPHLVTSIGTLAMLMSLAVAGYMHFSGRGFAILHGN